MKFKNKIVLLILLLIIGVGYKKYMNKLNIEQEKEDMDLIVKFLNGDVEKMDKRRPFLWIPLEYEINERNWLNFGSRNTTNLNQPYLYLTIRSIIEKCGDSFNVCLIDDNVFNKLIPNWTLRVSRLSNPLRGHLRELGMACLLQMYGGLRLEPSFICFENLYPMFMNMMQSNHIFVSELVSRNITSTTNKFYPNVKIMGCMKDCPIMVEYIKYLEGEVSRDFTNRMDFEGVISRWFHRKIQEGNCGLLKADYLGVKNEDENVIVVEELMGDTDINLSRKALGIYVPADELLVRRNYGWFVRMSPEQVLNSNTQVGKYLLATI